MRRRTYLFGSGSVGALLVSGVKNVTRRIRRQITARGSASEHPVSVRIIDSNAPVDGGDLLEVTAEVENNTSRELRPEIDVIIDGDRRVSVQTTVEAGETKSLRRHQHRTYPVERDDEVTVRFETDGDADERSFAVLAIDDLDAARTTPDRESSVRPGTQLLFEVESTVLDAPRSETHWFVDGTYEGHSMGPWYSAYYAHQNADFWRHDFESAGTYEVAAAVVGETQNYRAAWTIDVTSDGAAAPTIESSRPANESLRLLRGMDVDLELDVAADGALDRVIWWLGHADVVLEESDVSGVADEASLTYEGSCLGCPIIAWVIDEHNAITAESVWVIEEVVENEVTPRFQRGNKPVPVGSMVTVGVEPRADHLHYEWSAEETDDDADADEQLLHVRADVDDNRPVTTFRPTEPGSYEVEVTVTDGDELFGMARFEIEAITGETYDVGEETVSKLSLLERYAPVLHFHEEEEFTPTRYEALIESAQLMEYNRAGSDTVVREELTMLDLRAASSNTYLEPRGSEEDYRSATERYPDAVHGSVHNDVTFDGDEYTALCYWMFYVHDPKLPRDRRIGGPDSRFDWAETFEHTGDQEVVVVLLNDVNEPEWIAAQQHFGGEIRKWRKAERTGTHPHVYVALGAHSLYFTGGQMLPQYQYFRDYLVERATEILDTATVVDPTRTNPPGANLDLSKIARILLQRYGRPPDESATDIDFRGLEGGYVDYTERGTEPWSVASTVNDEYRSYEMVVLTDDEVWSDFEGDVYTYPNMEPILDSVIGTRGDIATETGRWHDLEAGIANWLEDDLYYDYQQRSASIVDPTAGNTVLDSIGANSELNGVIRQPNGGLDTIVARLEEGRWTIDLAFENDGPKPHAFALQITAEDIDSGTTYETDSDETPRVALQTGYTDYYELKDRERDEPTGPPYPGYTDYETKSVEWTEPRPYLSLSTPIDLPIPTYESGTWEVTVALWNYDPDVRERERDEQQDEVRFFVELDELPIDADVRSFDVLEETANPGDRVTANVTVENTGDEVHEFSVGFSTRSPETETDHYRGRGEEIRLEPDETGDVTVAWTVPEGIPAGSYEFATGVYRTAGTNGSVVQVAREISTDVVAIEPRPELRDIEVTPDVVTPGDDVTVTLTAGASVTRNPRQAITVGLPDLSTVDEETVRDRVSIEDHNLETDDDEMLIPSGAELGADYGDEWIESEYPVIEGWTTDHGPEDGELFLELGVTPGDTDEFRVQAKSVGATDDWQLVAGDPDEETGDRVDQQGEYVYEERVRVGGDRSDAVDDRQR